MAERRTMFMCEECTKWFFSMDVFTRHPCCKNNTFNDAQSSPRTLASSSPVTQTVTSERNDHPVDEYEYAGINLDGEIDEQVKVQEQQEQSLVWSRQATLLLIGEYKDRQERIDAGKLRKNKAFEEISKELNKAGYGFSHEQCSGRMKTITRAYKQVKDHNAKSGNDRKTYEYEIQLNELFSTRPNIEPKFVLSTNQEEADHSKDEKKEEQGKRKNSDTDSEGNNSGGKVRKTQASAVISYLETVTENINERYEKEQAKKDERHKERMGLFRDLIDALKEKK